MGLRNPLLAAPFTFSWVLYLNVNLARFKLDVKLFLLICREGRA